MIAKLPKTIPLLNEIKSLIDDSARQRVAVNAELIQQVGCGGGYEPHRSKRSGK